MLAKGFQPLDAYREAERAGYRLLPLRFIALDATRYVATNIAGEYIVLPRAAIEDIILHRVPSGSALYDELKSKHFIVDGDSKIARQLLGLKYRTKLSHLSHFTGLHMFVVTLRCEASCIYCQVSRQTEDKLAYDMTEETAQRALDFVFQSPSPSIKIEFQGGEPLLNFSLIRFIVEEAERRNRSEGRDLGFVIATNLSLLNDDILEYVDRHGIMISTSLDGPADLHNANRPRPGKNSHALAVAGIARIHERLGRDRVSALMTTTQASLKRARDIVDEYVRVGLHEIFLRPMSPYGFAVRGGHVDRYNADQWLDFYRQGLERILEVNRQGYPMMEVYSAIILQKMLTPQNPGYVDLQSPAGLAIAGIIYNYDGFAYASDESRMLAETGETRFRLGSVHTDAYETVFGNEWLLDTLESTVAEGCPSCSECAFVPYCGTDPIYHFETQGDLVGNKALSGFCRRNMEVFRHLIRLMEDSGEDRLVLRRWASKC